MTQIFSGCCSKRPCQEEKNLCSNTRQTNKIRSSFCLLSFCLFSFIFNAFLYVWDFEVYWWLYTDWWWIGWQAMSPYKTHFDGVLVIVLVINTQTKSKDKICCSKVVEKYKFPWSLVFLSVKWFMIWFGIVKVWKRVDLPPPHPRY